MIAGPQFVLNPVNKIAFQQNNNQESMDGDQVCAYDGLFHFSGIHFS
jgi:hypothetical protein